MAATTMGNRLGFVMIRRDATEESLALEKVPILVSNPVTNSIGAREPAVVSGKDLWGNAAFVCTVWARAVT